MISRALRSYQNLQTETAVHAATPGELIVLVYDRILEHLHHASTLISNQEDSAVPTQKALDLISDGLVAALDHERGGEVANNLAALYDWAIRTTLRGRLRRDPSLIEDVIRVLSSLREAWVAASGKETVAA